MKHSIQEFIFLLEEEFDDVESGTLKASTNYAEIASWSSMYALILVALVDTEYDVTLSASDLHNANTIQDLYNIVKERT